jgi:ABC-type lipoprotein export system ATPase subunit
MADALVVAKELGRRFIHAGGRSADALLGISCEIPPRARIALVGPSGSGKSSLLHIIGGLDLPTSGSIEWPGLGAFKELRPKNIGMLFQTPSLFPALSAAQNVTLPLILAREDRSPSHDARASALLEAFGLSGLANKLPEELSGGQAQRVAMARALACNPRLVLADEPTGQLDSRTAQLFLGAVLEQLDQTDAALVVATHDRDVAARMKTKWIMVHGRLVAEQTDG